ncbi:elongation factor P hydroxylase [Psychrobium sp. 1_MG-2023]|uniref:elongation factor P hydroxylase n=1 Tax=Psychrobium sp. 1_MG-2023 TaxID=3062624 RepID=UPI000C334940|nr:elongation factor P hydroxylase [Psychrobium sp. 1_MG-2023]MDP2560187.1 elongation factor P hydroxylase [Psychrobium sp. 1_MG-2023]PKF56998.1 ATPase [Alteromonadales bacterium alter-6D02]
MSQTNDSFDYNHLIEIFNQTFSETESTLLVKGGDEPIYLPQDETHDYHRIIFARGFYASALHEVAHWLVAGPKRRLIEDYGYWYCPDGRDKETQLAFEQVEVKPQAIEWALCLACGFDFNVSSDNLNGWQSDRFAFQDKVYMQLVSLIEQGFNSRTQTLLNALQHYYKTPTIAVKQLDYRLNQGCYEN